jgi:thiol-disulfide isomerase/thioredoxin
VPAATGQPPPLADVASAPPQPPAPGAFALPGPARRLTAAKGGPRVETFDLQSRLGRGRPVALIFWSPGFWIAERGLVAMADYLQAAAPAYEVYAVAPPREGLPEAAALETFELLRVPPALPLLFDDGYRLSSALGVRDLPDLVVFDRKGALVLSRVAHPRQKLETAAGVQSAAELLQAVAAGADIPPVTRAGPYYPGIERVGHCAPPFTLPAFDTGRPYTFGGRPASGRPALLMFWSSTCKHCQAEIPLLIDWLRAHPNRVDVVSITEIRPERLGQPSHRAITAAYIKEKQIPWPVLEDTDGAVDELYGTVSTPTSFFISPRGAVTGVWLSTHGSDLPAEMERELARASSAPGCAPGPPPAAARLDLNLTDPAGRSVGLQSLLDKPALVHLWATWCAPCMKELPGLLRFRDRLEREGVGRVVFVSVEGEGDGAKIASFEKKHGMDLRSYRAPRGGLADEVDPSYRVPRTFLVGPGGTLLGMRYGEQNWDDPSLTDRVVSRLRNAPKDRP